METGSASRKEEGIGAVGFDIVCRALAEVKRCDRRGSLDIRRGILSGLFRRLSTVKGRRGEDGQQRLISKDDFVPSLALEVDDAYMVLRLLAPEVDRERSWYGLKELSLAREYIKALNLSGTSAERKWLLNYMERDFVPRGNVKYRQAVSGSFTSVLEAVLSERCPKKGSLTIGRVDELLDTLVKYRPIHTRRIAMSGVGGGFAGIERLENATREDNTKQEGKEKESGEPKSALSESQMRTDVFRELVEKASAEENVWVVRIILKNLEARLGYEQVLEWYNPSGLKCYKQSHSLRTVVENCSDPSYNITRQSVTLGNFASVLNTARPVRRGLEEVVRMLKFRDTDRDNPPSPEEFESRYFFMEPKIDGERLVVHKQGSEIMTFSRKANVNTHIYGTMLKEALNDVVRADDAILDGEVYLMDKILGSTVKFEEMRKKVYAFLKHETLQSEQLMLVYCVFDVLYVDQKKDNKIGGLAPSDVLHLSCEHRRQILRNIIKPMSKEQKEALEYDVDVRMIQAEKGKAVEDIKRHLEKFVDQKYEGLIAKNCAMPYALGERNPKFASKLKPDYFDGGIVEIDAVIVGANFGTGTKSLRMGTLSSFFIGVLDETSSKGDNDEPRSFICVGSVGTGYSIDDLKALQSRLAPHWELYDPQDPPSWCDFYDLKPGRIIHPQHSLVLTVKAVELYYVKKYALRFPRVDRIRYDKPWTETITLEELKTLDMNKNPLTIVGDENDADDIGEGLGKRTEPEHSEDGGPGMAKKRQAMTHMKAGDISSVVVERPILNDMSFLVYGSTVQPTFKAGVERTIASLGGRVVQKMSPEVTYMVADSYRNTHVGIWRGYISLAGKGNKVALKGLTKDGGDRSIIYPKWFDRCKEQNKAVPLKPTEVIHASFEVDREMKKSYDSFGDHWTEPTTVESLTESFNKIDQLRSQRDEKVESLSTADADNEELSTLIRKTMVKAGRIFYGDRVAVDPQCHPLAVTIQLLRFYGANVIVDKADFGNATHLLINPSADRKFDGLNDRLKLVSEEWVQRSVQRREALPCFVDPKEL